MHSVTLICINLLHLKMNLTFTNLDMYTSLSVSDMTDGTNYVKVEPYLPFAAYLLIRATD